MRAVSEFEVRIVSLVMRTIKIWVISEVKSYFSDLASFSINTARSLYWSFKLLRKS